MPVRNLLLGAALAVISLWPQGLVLCVAPGDHADLENHPAGPCHEGAGECEDVGSPEARAPSKSPGAPAPDVPAGGEARAVPESPSAARVPAGRAAPPAPPASPVLTI